MECLPRRGEEACGRWARELVWAHGLGGEGRREAGGESSLGQWVQTRGFRGGARFEKKGRFISGSAQRLDLPAATAPGVAVEIVLSMANTEQVSPQDTWTSVMIPAVETGQPASLCYVSGFTGSASTGRETTMSSLNTQG